MYAVPAFLILVFLLYSKPNRRWMVFAKHVVTAPFVGWLVLCIAYYLRIFSVSPENDHGGSTAMGELVSYFLIGIIAVFISLSASIWVLATRIHKKEMVIP